MTTVYLVRNIINGHRYIGVTDKSLAARRNGAVWAALNEAPGPYAEALRHFGSHAFEWSILATTETRAEALSIERDLTRILRPEYNAVFGGGGRAHYLRAEPVHIAVRPAEIPTPFMKTPIIEEWRPVPEYEGLYEVSTHAQVRSLDRIEPAGAFGRPRHRKGRVLKFRRDKRDHRLSVILARDSQHKTFRLSTLVARSFIGPRPEGMEVCHLSDDKDDNAIGNLYYGTHQQNCDDRSRNGKTMRGAKATGVKLTEDQVREIKSALNRPGSVFQRELALRYGVTREAISRIAQGKNWAHVEVPCIP
jgi:hypothetical protein